MKMKQNKNKIPLLLPKNKILVVLTFVEEDFKFEIEYDSSCGIDEKEIRKEVEELVNNMLKCIK